MNAYEENMTNLIQNINKQISTKNRNQTVA